MTAQTPSPRRTLRVPVAIVAIVALLAVGVGSQSAAAATRAAVPCWKLLLNDWYDGVINKIYAIPCYQQAIDHLPADVALYSSAKEDILAAEQAAEKGQHAPNESSTVPTTTSTNPPKKKGGLSHLLDELTPGNPDSFPLPLLVLGGLAILLVIAGGAGMVWQRRNPRGPGAS